MSGGPLDFSKIGPLFNFPMFTKEKIDFITKLLFNKDLNDFEKKMEKIVKEKIIKIGTNSFILITNFIKKKIEYFKITDKLTLATPTFQVLLELSLGCIETRLYSGCCN